MLTQNDEKYEFQNIKDWKYLKKSCLLLLFQMFNVKVNTIK